MLKVRRMEGGGEWREEQRNEEMMWQGGVVLRRK